MTNELAIEAGMDEGSGPGDTGHGVVRFLARKLRTAEHQTRRRRDRQPHPAGFERAASRCSRSLGSMCLHAMFWLCTSGQAASADAVPFAIRSHNPFTRVFGLPLYPTAESTQPGNWDGLLIFDLVNHADGTSKDGEAVVLDGETYITNAIVSYGMSDGVRLGVDIPFLSHRPGALDGFIERWHDLWGISNGKREGPRNELNIRYSLDQSPLFTIIEPSSGIGDIRMWASYELLERGEGRSSVRTRATLKLPTGNSDDLHGSGAADLAWDVALLHTLHEGRTFLNLSAHVGVLALGSGEVLEEIQQDIVPYGGIGIVWRMGEHLDLLAQIYGQGSYFDSDLDELGASTLQLTAGARYRWPTSNLELLVGLVEDLYSDTTPDLAIHFELRKVFE